EGQGFESPRLHHLNPKQGLRCVCPWHVYRNVSTALFSSPGHPSSGKLEAARDRLAVIRHPLERFFNTREVDRDPRLKIILACLLSYYYLTFYNWWHWAPSLSTLGNTTFDYVPAPVLQNMRWLVFLNYGQTQVYMYFLGMLALLGLFSLFCLRSSLLAMCLLAILFVNKTYYYLDDIRLFHNFHHFHLFFTLVFLLSRDKLRFFRGALAVGYVMSAVVKFTPSWLQGEYFNSLPEKLPLFPKISWVVTVTGLSVVVMESLGPLIWFTSIGWLRRLSFAWFILFHLYSGLLVAFWYPSLMVPLVVAAFWRFDRPLQAGYRFSRRDLAPLIICALVIFAGLYHYFLRGNVLLTSEGRYYGFYMYDANKQVTFDTEISKGNKTWKFEIFRPYQTGATEEPDRDLSGRITYEFWQDGKLLRKSNLGHPIEDEGQVVFNPSYFIKIEDRKYGDPYFYYFYARELMRRYHPDKMSLHLDIQINGRPETTTLLDIPDFAKLNPTYSPFRHNDWVLIPGTNSAP
ncbi:MAG TPA: hypothetical protein VHW43_09590, partial [Puia sp.]|nr:hypothetical protein [Puia sp.]